MGWFTGEYEWVQSKNPVILKVFIDNNSTPATEKVYEEDLVYHNGALASMDLSDMLSDNAKDMANRRAYTIRTEGISIEGIHYPVHRIKRVEVVKGKWEWVQETQYVSKLEVQEDV